MKFWDWDPRKWVQLVAGYSALPSAATPAPGPAWSSGSRPGLAAHCWGWRWRRRTGAAAAHATTPPPRRTRASRSACWPGIQRDPPSFPRSKTAGDHASCPNSCQTQECRSGITPQNSCLHMRTNTRNDKVPSCRKHNPRHQCVWIWPDFLFVLVKK